MRRSSRLTGLLLAIAAVLLLHMPPSLAQTGEPQPSVSPSQEGPTEAAPPDAAPVEPEDAPDSTNVPEAKAEPDMARTPPAEPAPPATPEVPDTTTAEPTAPAAPQEPVAAAPPPATLAPKDVTLRIATWGGAYGESQDRAFFKPFTSRFGYQVEQVTFDGSYDTLKEDAGSPEWSLVDLDGETVNRACADELLEPLDASMLEASPDGASVADDFLPGAIQPCGIASVAWAAVIVFDEGLKRTPEALEDFFDLRKVPGKRLLPKQPRYTMEFALMADGVAPQDVYATLATPEGQDRAFAKLSTIKNEIVWWEKPSEVFGRIAKKEASMGLGFNGRAFMAMIGARQPIGLLWDHQIYAYDYWAIPRGAPHMEAAKEFIRFATAPGPLADQTRWMPYGPARKSAVQLVGKHAELDLDMKPHLPTYEPNLKTALTFDGSWWMANEDELIGRFEDWLEGRQLPTPKDAATSQ